jgi:hypothetical protein
LKVCVDHKGIIVISRPTGLWPKPKPDLRPAGG